MSCWIKMGDRLTTELATLDRDLNRLVAAAVPTLCDSDPKECEVRAHEKRGEFRVVQIEGGGCRRARTLHLAVSLGTTPCPPPEVRS